MEEFLSRIGELTSDFFGGLARGIERSITAVFGSSNARYLRRLQPTVAAIGALEPKYQEMTDAELKEQTAKFRERLARGETLDKLLVEAFAVCREAGRRTLGMRHFDVQLVGGMVLHRGGIAEMVTGEGKTLVATLSAYLNALEGKGVHVVTVNDYLARRDMEWMGPLYMALGLSVGAIQSHMETAERQKAYDCDITYGTNNEFGFDYLRDNMRPAAKGDKRYPEEVQQVQGPRHYAIIDEVDNILVDEARTPLIISGPAKEDVEVYKFAERVAGQLRGEKKQRTATEEREEEGEQSQPARAPSGEENWDGARRGESDFIVDYKEHSVHLTESGVRKAEKVLNDLIEKEKKSAGKDRRDRLERLYNGESFYTAGNMQWPHLVDNALKAHHLYKRDVNYVVNNSGEVVIVDEFTGRLMPGRNWSDGLHQAVEAKEGVTVKEQYQTLATITLQNFFKLYDKICGMTGTAMTEATEFWKIYKLDVIAIPPNKPLRRVNHADVILRSEREKYQGIAEEIERMHKWDVLVLDSWEECLGRILRETDEQLEFQPKGSKQHDVVPRRQIRQIERRGRPILVGTVSIKRSELISRLLDERGVKHQVLNAKHHQREAEIVAQAGRKGAVTIATNMAGRGTDIILGGNPQAMAWALLQEQYPTRLEVPGDVWDSLVAEIEQREQMKVEGREVAAMGGLHIIGSERHEARRIDLQLRGRAGRQGDPGSSRFYLSLEDDLMRIFAGEWVKNVLTRLGMKEGEAIESRMVSRRIEGAQKKVEERNFEIRKNLLEYDEVMDEQRKRVYGFRQDVLDGANCKQMILEMIQQQIDYHLGRFLDKDHGTATFAEWAGKKLAIDLDARSFRGMDFPLAQQFAKDEADRMVESQVLDALEENLPADVDPRDWNWEALAKLVSTRWHLSVRERELKQVGREQLGEFLIERAREAVQQVDLGDGAGYLQPDYGVQEACDWVQRKFGIELAPDEVRSLELEQFKPLVRQRAQAAYQEKEAEYPVKGALERFMPRDPTGQVRRDREGLVGWAGWRFQVALSLEELKNRQRDDIYAVLLEHSRAHLARMPEAMAEAERRLDEILENNAPRERAIRAAFDKGRLQELADWLLRQYRYQLTPEEMLRLRPQELENQVAAAVEDEFRREMRRTERNLLLQHLDTAWKEHLLTMDHLRSSVGLRGYAHVDPKVEYKREGMRLFEQMWNGVRERVTDQVFRVEQTDEGFIASIWSRGEAIHQEATSAAEIAEQQQAAIDGTQTTHKQEPIRNRQQRVGRNDPCPCGSGKKYKKCCWGKGGMGVG